MLLLAQFVAQQCLTHVSEKVPHALKQAGAFQRAFSSRKAGCCQSHRPMLGVQIQACLNLPAVYDLRAMPSALFPSQVPWRPYVAWP